MKTKTIFEAWNLITAYNNDTFSEVPARHERQAIRFYNALLRRIEAGDRAREALPRIARAIQTGDYDMAMGIILDKFMREQHPEHYRDEKP
jgi:hypothetical protein